MKLSPKDLSDIFAVIVAYGHRCMAPAVESRGEWFKRDDGCSVVFKKKEA